MVLEQEMTGLFSFHEHVTLVKYYVEYVFCTCRGLRQLEIVLAATGKGANCKQWRTKMPFNY